MIIRPFRTLLSLGILGTILAGCAATHTAVQISKAKRSVNVAKERGAEEHAIYEYTMAENYLRKSREEAGYSDFKDSVSLATGAAEWADKAIIVIEKEGRDVDLDSLPGETRTFSEEELSRPLDINAPEEELSDPDSTPQINGTNTVPALPHLDELPEADEPTLAEPQAQPDADTPQDTQEDTPQDTQEDTPQDTQEDTPQNTQEDTPQNTQEDTPQDTQEDTPKEDPMEEALKKALENSLGGDVP